jgi:DNA-binding GntR family transcriptional regulator
VYTSSGTASRGEVAYADLKRRLLVGDFPLVDRLGEERLAALLSVSRTPVREALARLHAEGLVERHPEGGYRPAPPDLRRTHELYHVRFALEYYALRLPGETGTGHDLADLDRLREEWEQLEPPAGEPGDDAVDPAFVLLDEEFHVRLAAAAGNAALADTLVGVNERIRPVRMHDFLTAERVQTTIDQHLGVLAALLDHDVDEAEARLRFHHRQSLDVVEERAAAALTRMLGGRADIGGSP